MSAVVTSETHADRRIVLSNVRWQTYQMLLQDIGDGHTRLTYDRGRLDIMAPSFRHENYGRRLGKFVGVIAEELNIAFTSAGSTTFRREDLERGLEPDECFYFKSLSLILGKSEIDLNTDPPPDLAIEVDISSSQHRMSIYAALGVPEIWRFDGETIQVYQLRENGEYESCSASPTFPNVPLGELVRFLHDGLTMDEVSLMRSFREWVRKEVLPKWKGVANGK